MSCVSIEKPVPPEISITDLAHQNSLALFDMIQSNRTAGLLSSLTRELCQLSTWGFLAQLAVSYAD
jgi:hypothetical protein